ncbi:alpha2 macroglobulin isoform 2, partial [Danaus plexippus plexippus]
MKMKWLLLLFVLPAQLTGTPQNLTSSPCTDRNHIFLMPGALTAGGSSRACVSRFYTEGSAQMTLTLNVDGETVTSSRDLHRDGGCLDISVPQRPNSKADVYINIRYPQCVWERHMKVRVSTGRVVIVHTERARYRPGDLVRVRALVVKADLTPAHTAVRDGGCLDISVPQRPNSKADVYINIRYPQCVWERHMRVRVSTGRVVIVHTERARYRPGDLVRVRALVVKADLTPAHTAIDEIWLEGPGGWGVKTAQWLKLRPRLGLVQVQHQLDDSAPPGKWRVRTRLADGAQGSSSFLVGNYELPPFQLTVRHSPRILRTSERLVWTVCVRYPWSEAVEGMLVIRLRGAGGGDGAGIRTAVRLKAPRACHRHAAAAKRIGLNGDNPPDVVVADFSFEEEGTGVWQNTTVVSQVVDEAVTLEFLTKHRVIISPGLPHKIKIKATRWDNKPAAGERVNVCRSASSIIASEFNSTEAICVNATTDEKGIARVMFNADNSPYYNLQASINNTRTTTQVLVVRSGRAALGALRSEQHGAALLPLYIDLKVVAPLTVHFVVITRGGIIFRWGATTQCPITSPTDKIITSPRNSICPNTNPYSIDKILNNNLESNSTELETLLDNYLSKVMLPIKVSPQMCPESHLLAYFYHNDELITASKHFEMEDCFVRKVDASWSPRLVAPGSLATLQLTTPGPALCALTVLDTASKWIQYENIRELVMNGLRTLMDSHRNLTEHDAAWECFLTSESPVLSTSRDLLSWWLASAGVRLLGDHPSSCEAPELMIDDVLPRSDFSESWLWKLAPVSSRGSLSVTSRAPHTVTRYEATALCVSRAGLAISSPAVLQVFREVFIHASGPRRVRRGDAILVPYRVFNYLYTPHAVEIIITTNHVVDGLTREVVCLSARTSTARRMMVTCQDSDLLSIRATGVKDANCSTDYREFSDEVVIHIQVDPEGVPVREMKSALLCGVDSVNFTSSSEVTWDWSSERALPGTESLTVWTTTDLMGPLLAHADGLVDLPRGCGEQNMARLATALLALRLLEPHSPAADDAKDQVARGFTRQLQYAHVGGGFSAFGKNDPTPSTWLTAFSLRYMRKAYEVISGSGPLPPVLELSRDWLLNQQLENGCFSNTGHVFHHLLKGGLDEDGEIANVALTAYVIASLTETSLPYKILNNSLPCLRALVPMRTKTNSRVYAQALITYAFMKLRKYEELGNDTLMGSLEEDYLRELIELLRIAKRSGDFVWWETGNLATSIESTGYALLSLSECPPRRGCEVAAAGSLRWLAAHRGTSGGFLSTQDTLVALEGMSRLSPLPAGGLVTLQSGDDTRIVTPTAVPELVTMKVDQLRVTVEGPGCALVQATHSYNTLEPHEYQLEPSSLSVHTNVQTDGPFDCVNDVCFCAAIVK